MNLSRALMPGILLRLATLEDAEALAEAQVRSRDHLRPWDPRRTDAWFTAAGQATRLLAQLERHKNGQVVPWVLVEGDRIIGAATLTDIVPGPFRSASLGYWVDGGAVGRGLATAAVRAVADIADTELRLHRIEASTLTNNLASQRVLAKCGFSQIGTAPAYLHIDGAWRDCHLFQRILNSREPGA
ncbi:MAG: [ribosomal protein S5]-alanine N-acetyltransferase [Kribbellaceae bacterium]|jgi:ribosomal-protein-alanine N-acetyltransferase|nr:[ribosomal protein S5]-alanine N-acetyltransferase [Kribbellaceae bacterium]